MLHSMGAFPPLLSSKTEQQTGGVGVSGVQEELIFLERKAQRHFDYIPNVWLFSLLNS